jgi:hypothetical protein
MVYCFHLQCCCLVMLESVDSSLRAVGAPLGAGMRRCGGVVVMQLHTLLPTPCGMLHELACGMGTGLLIEQTVDAARLQRHGAGNDDVHVFLCN